MVIKGKARGGPVALAVHLERRDTNEQVFIRELRGVTARDVKGALREMDAMGAGATSVRTLYHASINTAPGERLTEAQKKRAAEKLERELGLTGQPRIIVEHLKNDREHMHVVFLRIDTARMVAIPDSHNYRRHEIVARELEREFGHDRVQGAHIERGDRARPERTPSHAEMQQGERSKLTPQDAKARVTALWRETDSSQTFIAALKADGWTLARGDRRDFVIVDKAGEAHSLSRRIDGVRAAEVRQRMSAVNPATLPDVEEARAIQRRRVPAPVIEPSQPHHPLLRISIPDAPPLAIEPLVLMTQSPALLPSADIIAKPVHQKAGSDHAKNEASTRPAPALFQQLFTAAAEVTQKVVGRARDLLGRQPRQKSRLPAQPFVPMQQPIPAVTPESETVKPRSYRRRSTAAELTELLERQRAQNRDIGKPER